MITQNFKNIVASLLCRNDGSLESGCSPVCELVTVHGSTMCYLPASYGFPAGVSSTVNASGMMDYSGGICFGTDNEEAKQNDYCLGSLLSSSPMFACSTQITTDVDQDGNPFIQFDIDCFQVDSGPTIGEIGYFQAVYGVLGTLEEVKAMSDPYASIYMVMLDHTVCETPINLDSEKTITYTLKTII